MQAGIASSGATIAARLMLIPSMFHFSQIDQELLSTGTATRLLTACLLGGAELRASDATDQVVAFRDAEAE